MEINTVAISDGVTMGTEGMKAFAHLPRGDRRFDRAGRPGYLFDAMAILVGCDKTIPAGAMALLRLNVPGVVLYGGSILPGRFHDRDVTIMEVFEGVGANAAGKCQTPTEELEDSPAPPRGPAPGSTPPTPWPWPWSSSAWPLPARQRPA